MTAMFQPTLDIASSRLELYDLVAHHPDATFFVRYEGYDLAEFSISNGDILVIDRSVTPKPGKLILATIDEEFTLTKFPENKSAGQNKPNKTSIDEMNVWGTISYVIHKL